MWYLYTKQECGGCETARSLLIESHKEFKEVPIDNPLVEVGIQIWFKDGLVHAPILFIPDGGIYMLNGKEFVLIKSLKVIENNETNQSQSISSHD